MRTRTQQRPVVQPLGVPDQSLVTDLGDEEVHVHSAGSRRHQPTEHRVVRHEVRACDEVPARRRQQQAEEQLQVVLDVESRTTRDYLASRGVPLGAATTSARRSFGA